MHEFGRHIGQWVHSPDRQFFNGLSIHLNTSIRLGVSRHQRHKIQVKAIFKSWRFWRIVNRMKVRMKVYDSKGKLYDKKRILSVELVKLCTMEWYQILNDMIQCLNKKWLFGHVTFPRFFKKNFWSKKWSILKFSIKN